MNSGVEYIEESGTLLALLGLREVLLFLKDFLLLSKGLLSLEGFRLL